MWLSCATQPLPIRLRNTQKFVMNLASHPTFGAKRRPLVPCNNQSTDCTNTCQV
jgi:hypothetical protein